MSTLKLIVGLGNPGPSYLDTRHNAGQNFVESLARHYRIDLKADKKYAGLLGTGIIEGKEIKLLIPTTFMNRSGQSVGPLCHFYKIAADEILVAHDELDIPAGTAKLKLGGSHGGHNGLRDIISALGNNNQFYRLRLGIGHPGDSRQVSDYVLKKHHQANLYKPPPALIRRSVFYLIYLTAIGKKPCKNCTPLTHRELLWALIVALLAYLT